jgi:hypothetical protein
MTQNLEKSRLGWTDGPGQPQAARPAQRWWIAPAWAALAAVVIFNLLYGLPKYLSLNPAASRVPIYPSHPAQFPLLVTHVTTGCIALVTVAIQLVPWIRRHHLTIHKVSGFIYVFLGAIPAALCGLYVLPLSPAPTGKVGLAAMAIAWIATTVTGFVKYLQGKPLEHRRWMFYSFALALGTSWGRIMTQLLRLDPSYHVNEMVYLELTSWLWVVNILVAQWWWERTLRKRGRVRVAQAKAAQA